MVNNRISNYNSSFVKKQSNKKKKKCFIKNEWISAGEHGANANHAMTDSLYRRFNHQSTEVAEQENLVAIIVYFAIEVAAVDVLLLLLRLKNGIDGVLTLFNSRYHFVSLIRASHPLTI